MPVTTTLSDEVAEGSTPLITGTFKDEAGVAVQPSAATLTMFDLHSGSIVNSRDDTDILASITAGALSWRLAAADTAILDTTRAWETRMILIEWEWGVGPLKQKHLIEVRVRNLEQVP